MTSLEDDVSKQPDNNNNVDYEDDYHHNHNQMEEKNHLHHVSILFYQWQFLTTVIWWLLVKITTHQSLYDVTYGSVTTRPSWLSRHFLYKLQRPHHRRWIFRLSLVALGIGGWGPQFLTTPETFISAIDGNRYLESSGRNQQERGY